MNVPESGGREERHGRQVATVYHEIVEHFIHAVLFRTRGNVSDAGAVLVWQVYDSFSTGS